MRVATDRASALEWFGRTAGDPAVAATLVAATAVAFSAVWFSLATSQWTLVAFLFPATVANAYVVTRVVWRVAVPAGTWTYRRGVGAGLAVGVVSHLTVGYAWVLAIAVYGTTAGPGAYRPGWSLAESLAGGLLFGLYSVPMTLGIPVLLSVGVALGLTYARRQVASTAGDRPGAGS